MPKWFTQGKVYIIVAVVVLLILAAVYYYGYSSKPTSVVTVTNDEGAVLAITPQQQNEADSLAQVLYDNLSGGWGIWYSAFADVQVFRDLASTSNVVFALTFAAYKNKYKRSLLADMRSALIYFNTEAMDACIQRAEVNKIKE